jgi:hypothetical protein
LASLPGGATAAFGTGSSSDIAGPPGSANSGWNTTTYPTQGTANKTAGVQFRTSTAGYKNILLTWEERHSNTASKYTRLQYSTDGTTFTDGPVITMSNTNNEFVFYYADLSGIPAVNDNANFAFQIVAEWESTAINNGNPNYGATVTSYGTSGTIRFDLVNVYGSSTGGAPSPIPLAIQLVGTNAVLSWTDPSGAFALASASSVTGTFAKLTGASSPYTNAATGSGKFFRLVYP